MQQRRQALWVVLFLFTLSPCIVHAQQERSPSGTVKDSIAPTLAVGSPLVDYHELSVDLMPLRRLIFLNGTKQMQINYKRVKNKNYFSIGYTHRVDDVQLTEFRTTLTDTTISSLYEAPKQDHYLVNFGWGRTSIDPRGRTNFYTGIDAVMGLKRIRFDYSEWECRFEEGFSRRPYACELVSVRTAKNLYWSSGLRANLGGGIQFDRNWGINVEIAALATFDVEISSEGEIERHDDLKRIVYWDFFPLHQISWYFRW